MTAPVKLAAAARQVPQPPGAGRPARWRAWAADALRRHWLAGLLLAAGLVLRAGAQLAYRPALFYIDTPRYLYNAEGMDPVGYKGPLVAIFSVANFDAVALVQHLLGLAIAVVLYLLLRRRGVPRWLSALATAPVLLDGYQLQMEQTVMPGTWFEALIVAGLAILLWRPRPGWRRSAAAGVVLGTSATFAQVGEALIAPGAVLVLLAAGGGWRQAAGKAAALCGAFALPILLYCTGSYLMTGDFFLSHSGVTSLYGRMAAAADCPALRLPRAERAMCPAPAQQARGPDWLEYGDGSPIRPYYNDLPRAETDSLISDFNHRVLTQQPLRVLAAYGRDVVKLYAPGRTGSPGDPPISRWQFQQTFPYFPHATPAVVGAAIGRWGGGRPAVWRPVAVLLRSYQLGGGYTPGPLLALCTVTGLAGSLAALRRRPGAAGGPGGAGSPSAAGGPAEAGDAARERALTCLAFFTAGAALLLVSDVFEFSWRYQLPALVTLVPAGAAGIAVLADLARTRRGQHPAWPRWRSARQDPG